MEDWIVYCLVAIGAALISVLMVKYASSLAWLRIKVKKALEYLRKIEGNVPESLAETYLATVKTLDDFMVCTEDGKMSYEEAWLMVQDAYATYKALKKLKIKA